MSLHPIILKAAAFTLVQIAKMCHVGVQLTHVGSHGVVPCIWTVPPTYSVKDTERYNATPCMHSSKITRRRGRITSVQKARVIRVICWFTCTRASPSSRAHTATPMSFYFFHSIAVYAVSSKSYSVQQVRPLARYLHLARTLVRPPQAMLMSI